MHEPRSFVAIYPEGMHRPRGSAHAMWAGDTLYVAAQVATDGAGALVGAGDAAAQAKQVWGNVSRVLAAAGAGPEDVVKVTTYLTPGAEGAAIAAERLRVFGDHRPPHTGLVVAALGSPGALFAVEVIAHRVRS
jgi:2-iminobutanoate/2-iminopropanoate deaminase